MRTAFCTHLDLQLARDPVEDHRSSAEQLTQTFAKRQLVGQTRSVWEAERAVLRERAENPVERGDVDTELGAQLFSQSALAAAWYTTDECKRTSDAESPETDC
jgi:hypothetical protein